MKKLFIFSLSFTALLVPALSYAATAGDVPFVPLTSLPGITDVAATQTLPALFNGLYKICIGVAATLAVLVIMKAGVEFMTNTGSVSSNEKAKGDLRNAIIGLILVLSPAIVFGIINPKILDLNINVGGLKQGALQNVDTTAPPGSGGGGGGGSTPSGTPTVNGMYLKSGTFSASDQNVAVNQANAILNSCTTPPSGGVIDSYKKSGPTVSCTTQGTGGTCNTTQAKASCQAVSKYFQQYATVDAQNIFKWVTGYEANYNTFRNGCIADGGNPTDRAFKDTCGDYSNKAIATLEPSTDMTSVTCKSLEVTCNAK